MKACDIFYLLPQGANIIIICGDYLQTFVCSELTHGFIPDPRLVDIVCNHQIYKIHPLDEMNIILVID